MLSVWLLLQPPIFSAQTLKVTKWHGLTNYSHSNLPSSEWKFYPIIPSGEIIWAQLNPFNAQDFSILTAKITGRSKETQVAVLWRSADNPNKINQYKLAWPIGNASALNLTAIRQWNGQIINLGIAVGGHAIDSVHIYSIHLQSMSALGKLQLLWTEATNFEGFRPYTINFIYGGIPSNNYISSVSIVTIWIIIASTLNFIQQLIIDKRIYSLPFYLIFITGWIILDIRWQWELIRQRNSTLHKYANHSIATRRFNDKDGAMFKFINTVKELLPPPPQRIILILGNPGANNLALTPASFFLRPHNVYAEDTLPLCQNRINSGDYVLALGFPKMLHYAEQQLSWEGCKDMYNLNNPKFTAKNIVTTSVGQLFLIK
jgi:hypothetical protein